MKDNTGMKTLNIYEAEESCQPPARIGQQRCHIADTLSAESISLHKHSAGLSRWAGLTLQMDWMGSGSLHRR